MLLLQLPLLLLMWLAGSLAGLAAVLTAPIPPLTRFFRERQAISLMGMWVAGTGWGGDDFALDSIRAVPDIAATFERLLERRTSQGQPTGMLPFFLKLVRL